MSTRTEQLLRRALNKRIRHAKSRLRIKLRRKNWRRVLKHPELIALVGDLIRERAARPSLFRVLLGVDNADV